MRLFNALPKGKLLSRTKLTEDWMHLCDQADFFNYYDPSEITGLVEIPSRLGTLVIRNDGSFITEKKPLEVIEKWQRTHLFIGSSLKPSASKGLVLLKTDFHLVSMPFSQSSIWLNPLKVCQLHTKTEDVLVELSNGLWGELPMDSLAFSHLAIEGIYSFALNRCKQLAIPSTPQLPLDLVQILDTPFGEKLKNHVALQQWLHVPNEIRSHCNVKICPQVLTQQQLFLADRISRPLITA